MIRVAVLGIALMAPLGADVADAEAATWRSCGTTADGFPGVVGVGPTSCGFAKRVANAFEAKRMPSYEIRPHIWMPRATWVRAYSPKMHRSYRMYCHPRMTRESPYVTCTGGKGARVNLVS
jgi:hypothetical protein